MMKKIVSGLLLIGFIGITEHNNNSTIDRIDRTTLEAMIDDLFRGVDQNSNLINQ